MLAVLAVLAVLELLELLAMLAVLAVLTVPTLVGERRGEEPRCCHCGRWGSGVEKSEGEPPWLVAWRWR